ncbi:MAG: aldehyde ferredoxin oxidoreductase family protein [Bacillota bacterium]
MTGGDTFRGGYAGRTLRVNLTRGSHAVERLEPDRARQFLGGRGLNSWRLFEEVSPQVDPLGEENRLIIGVGPLTGTGVSGASRVTFTALSPQTKILGDANAGGFFGPELKFAGFDQVIIEGISPRPAYLLIADDRVEIKDAAHLQGRDVPGTQAAIRDELGDQRVQVACIGPAAENGVRFAGIFCNAARAAARTGMGAVMAAKNLKAVAVRGTGAVQVADPGSFGRRMNEINRELLKHPDYPVRVRMGTTMLVSALNRFGCLATRHFQTGCFEGAEMVSGERLASTYKRKGKACYACNIPCSRHIVVRGEDGFEMEGPEFEGLAGFSSRVGVDHLETALRAADYCNRVGMDVISASEVISFMMELYERGIVTREECGGLELRWGNGSAVLNLLQMIARREGPGDLLADGVLAAAARLGRKCEALAMQVKGLEIFQADPRGIKAYALGIAVASRGGDHCRSEPSFEFNGTEEEALRRYGTADAAHRLRPGGKGWVVKDAEERAALADSLTMCKNTVVNMEAVDYAGAAALLEEVTGASWGAEQLQVACERIVNLERLYLVRAGITSADDRLPARFTDEPLPPDSGPSAGSRVELDVMLREYYHARGWDEGTGRPTGEKLAQLGLPPLA